MSSRRPPSSRWGPPAPNSSNGNKNKAINSVSGNTGGNVDKNNNGVGAGGSGGLGFDSGSSSNIQAPGKGSVGSQSIKISNHTFSHMNHNFGKSNTHVAQPHHNYSHNNNHHHHGHNRIYHNNSNYRGGRRPFYTGRGGGRAHNSYSYQTHSTRNMRSSYSSGNSTGNNFNSSKNTIKNNGPSNNFSHNQNQINDTKTSSALPTPANNDVTNTNSTPDSFAVTNKYNSPPPVLYSRPTQWSPKNITSTITTNETKVVQSSPAETLESLSNIQGDVSSVQQQQPPPPQPSHGQNPHQPPRYFSNTQRLDNSSSHNSEICSLKIQNNTADVFTSERGNMLTKHHSQASNIQFIKNQSNGQQQSPQDQEKLSSQPQEQKQDQNQYYKQQQPPKQKQQQKQSHSKKIILPPFNQVTMRQSSSISPSSPTAVQPSYSQSMSNSFTVNSNFKRKNANTSSERSDTFSSNSNDESHRYLNVNVSTSTPSTSTPIPTFSPKRHSHSAFTNKGNVKDYHNPPSHYRNDNKTYHNQAVDDVLKSALVNSKKNSSNISSTYSTHINQNVGHNESSKNGSDSVLSNVMTQSLSTLSKDEVSFAPFAASAKVKSFIPQSESSQPYNKSNDISLNHFSNQKADVKESFKRLLSPLPTSPTRKRYRAHSSTIHHLPPPPPHPPHLPPPPPLPPHQQQQLQSHYCPNHLQGHDISLESIGIQAQKQGPPQIRFPMQKKISQIQSEPKKNIINDTNISKMLPPLFLDSSKNPTLPGKALLANSIADVNTSQSSTTSDAPPRPNSPVSAPPSSYILALSRLIDATSQMEFAYAKYRHLNKKHNTLTKKIAYVKNLPIGGEAFKEEFEALKLISPIIDLGLKKRASRSSMSGSERKRKSAACSNGKT